MGRDFVNVVKTHVGLVRQTALQGERGVRVVVIVARARVARRLQLHMDGWVGVSTVYTFQGIYQ